MTFSFWLWMLIGAGAFTAIFAAIVVSAPPRQWDRAVYAWFQARAPRSGRGLTMAHDFSALGGDAIRITLLLCGALLLAMAGHASTALWLVAVFTSARLALILGKRCFPRPRPDADGHLTRIFTASFPSGHTMMTIVLGLSFATLLPQGWVQAAGIALALILGAVAGIARIVLGVHWPSDVVAGWTAGLAWVSGCVIAGAYL